MAYEVFWYIENRVIGSRLYGNVTEADLEQHGARVDEHIRIGTKPLFIIINALEMTQYPAHLKDTIEAIGKNRPVSGDVAWTLVVTDSRFINFIGAIVTNVFKIPMRACKSIAEAEAFVAYHAPELTAALEARRSTIDSAVS